MESRTVLSAKNLSIGYHSKRNNNTIAENINLNLKQGRLIALIGANGIGKSTLLRTITGIQKPLTGEILLNNKVIADYSPSALAQNLSIVLTESLPPSSLTVFELVALGRQPYTNWLGTLSAEDIEQVNNSLELTQITNLSNRKHYEISDGQLQKVLIARALAQDTPLIVLDEPTTHLDLLHKAGLLRLLKKLSEDTNKSILYSTHDLDLALQLSDEIIIMTENKLLQDTPLNLIKNNELDKLFNDESIRFDAEKGRFIVVS